jgi:hypothetical protein
VGRGLSELQKEIVALIEAKNKDGFALQYKDAFAAIGDRYGREGIRKAMERLVRRGMCVRRYRTVHSVACAYGESVIRVPNQKHACGIDLCVLTPGTRADRKAESIDLTFRTPGYRTDKQGKVQSEACKVIMFPANRTHKKTRRRRAS